MSITAIIDQHVAVMLALMLDLICAGMVLGSSAESPLVICQIRHAGIYAHGTPHEGIQSSSGRCDTFTAGKPQEYSRQHLH